MFKAFKENQAQTSADGSDSTTNTAVAMRELQKHPAFAEMYSGVYNDRVLPGVLLLQVSTQTELAAMLVLEATWKRCGIPIESRSAERAEWKPLVNQSEEDSNDHPACTTPPAALQFVLGHKSWQRLLKEMPDRPASSLMHRYDVYHAAQCSCLGKIHNPALLRQSDDSSIGHDSWQLPTAGTRLTRRTPGICAGPGQMSPKPQCQNAHCDSSRGD